MIILLLLTTFIILYGIAAIYKNKLNKQEDERIKQSIQELINTPKLSNEAKRKMLMSLHKGLITTVQNLEENAKTIEHFAQIDRIKRNIKLILIEYKKLETD